MNCTLIRVEYSTSQFFWALGPATDVELDHADAQETGSLPLALLVGEWIYASGYKPVIESSEGVHFSASSSKLVLHRLATTGTSGANVRAIAIDVGAGRTATITAPGDSTLNLTSGEYADVLFDSSGQFLNFDGPHPFDAQSTQGSVTIMAVIEAEKTARNID